MSATGTAMAWLILSALLTEGLARLGSGTAGETGTSLTGR